MKFPTTSPPLTVAIIIAFLLNVNPMFAQSGDYGDAPDGGTFGAKSLNFPSLNASDCPIHTSGATSTYSISKFWGGIPDSESDSKQVNQDIDNGQPFIFVNVLGIPAPAKVTVPIKTTAGHNPGTTLYLNVAIDVDNDFDYDNSPDQNWILRNHSFKMPADTTIGITTPNWFGFGGDLILFPVWLRATVTETPVPSDWNTGSASNTFTTGETEDWFYPFGATEGFPPDWLNPPMPPGDPDTLPKKPPPNPPVPVKCAKLTHPKKVYVKCEEVKCVWFKIENCGTDTLKDVNIGFSFAGGTPPGSGPTVVPAGALPVDLDEDGDFVWFLVCVTGWPCPGTNEGARWARYTINLTYDPDGLYWEEIGELVLGNNEDPIIDSTFFPKLAAHPVDSSDIGPWETTIGQSISKDLMVWYGRYMGIPWIIGNPKLTPLKLPSWATFSFASTTSGFDTTYYNFTGTPGQNDYGLDSAVFLVESTVPSDTFSIALWKLVMPILVNNINTTPQLTTILNSNYTLMVNNNDVLNLNLTAVDADITAGKPDTLFMSYYLWDVGGDSLYEPSGTVTLTRTGVGESSFSWTPNANDIGNYEFVAVTWDYAFAKDTSTAVVTVIFGSGIESTIPIHYVLEQNTPNPFNNSTQIRFGIPNTEFVNLTVYNIEGKEVITLYEGVAEAGYHKINWDSGTLDDGIYFYRLKAGEFTKVLSSVKLE